MSGEFYNCDCIEGCRRYLADDSVDLIITDPPYGIDGGRLHQVYNRDESYVLDDYVDVPKQEYAAFSEAWIAEAARILRPGGSLYVVSGYTHLREILNALAATQLREVNHIIWQYSFGVYTKNKWVSSHYHILYYEKQGGKRTFNTFANFADFERGVSGEALNYRDRIDVWRVNREYQPAQRKTKNHLPAELLKKIIQYSSNEGDLICDLFLGSFSTAKVAIGLARRAVGFEISQSIFDYEMSQMERLRSGWMLDAVRKPPANRRTNQGKPLKEQERDDICAAYARLRESGLTKKSALESLSERFGRGIWSLSRIVQDETRFDPPMRS